MHGGPIVRHVDDVVAQEVGSSYMGLDEAETWPSFLAELGAEQLPVPRPKRIPPWWAHRFGGPARTTKWADE